MSSVKAISLVYEEQIQSYRFRNIHIDPCSRQDRKGQDRAARHDIVF